MSGTGPADASAPTGGMAGVSLSHLPWQQIPRFVPGSTNVDDYGRRLQFLKALWPPEHVAQLGPRAALQVEGSAFQKISRIDPEQLRSEKGVQLIVEALGGAWGRTTVEDKYHTFEQAMFQVQQKPDESNDSYIARHDAFFEELLSKHIKLEEIRAYILLRHSQLSAEDKKRVVVESKGQLDYDTTVKAVRLLGSRFFHDLQVRGSSSHSRGSERTKVYDINFAEEDQGADEEVHYATEDVDEEALVAYYVEQNDEDAIYVAEFEDQIIETIQDSDLAPIFSAYQDARQRLREKAKARGYWPAKGRGKGKSKKGKSNHKGAPRGRTLAERIATSACRLCGQVGHWKRECPQRQDKTETTNLAHLSQDIPELPEIFQHLPEDTVLYTDEDPMTCYCPAGFMVPGWVKCGSRIQCFEQACFHVTAPKARTLSSFKETLARRLLMFDRSHRHQMQNGKQPPPANGGILSRAEKSESRDRPKIDLCPEDAVFVATVGSEGVLDTGASRTVIGGDRVKEVLRALPAECRKNVRKASSSVTFRFGNSGTLSSKHALLVPSPAGRWIRIEVIPGSTPLLISNRLLRELDAIIHVKRGLLQVGDKMIPTRFDDRGLSLVDLAELLSHPSDAAYITDSPDRSEPTSNQQHVAPKPPSDQDFRSRSSSTSASLPRLCVSQDAKPAQAGHQCPGGACSSRPRPAAVRRGGHQPCEGEAGAGEVSDCHVRQATGHRNVARVGRSGAARGEAQAVDACPSVQQGHGVCSFDGPKDIVDESMGFEFQKLLHCAFPESCRGQAPWGDDCAKGPEAGPSEESRSNNSAPPRERGQRRLEAMCDRERAVEQREIGEASQSCQQFVDDAGTDAAGHHRPGPDAHQHPSSAPASRAQSPRAVGAAPEGGADGPCVNPSAPPDITRENLRVCHAIRERILEIEQKLADPVNAPLYGPGSRYRLPTVDVIEVSASVGNVVGATIRKMGGKAVVLNQSKDIGTLKDSHGKLWQMMYMYEPNHLFVDVRQPWSRSHIGDSKDCWPYELLQNLYEHQLEHGRHFHLCCGPQFFESAMPDQVASILQGTLCTVHHLPELGKGQAPPGNNFRNRRTLLHTTSRSLHEATDTRKIAATMSHAKSSSGNTPPRVPELHRHFNICVAKTLLQNRVQGMMDYPLMMSELLFGETVEAPQSELVQPSVQEASGVFKRRRLLGKQPPPRLSGPEDETWDRVFQEVNPWVPKGGSVFFDEGDSFVSKVQTLVPEFVVKHVVVCRGTNRVRPPKEGWSSRDIPVRRTVVVKRDGTGICEDGGVEEWGALPRYKQMRKGIPAKVSLTAYGIRNVKSAEANFRGSLGAAGSSSNVSDSPVEPRLPLDIPPESSGSTGVLEVGYPPKTIPKHGPAFLSLTPEEKNEVTRLHNNLGHPSVEVLTKFMTERKAEPRMIQAVRDYACSICLETVPQPHLSRPASVHLDGDFGDVIGMDVAYWTNAAGRKFMFTHVLDEATLFQQADATGRTPEEQFEFLADHWFQWAGPCKLLYVDPAGEYTGNVWRDRLQQEGIRAQVSAGEAHWQLGRVEAHGKILKAMLTRMDQQEPINSDAEFRRSLRHAVLAKNSLSRVKGFTPEQAVLGKMSRLPASLVSDTEASSHAMAASDTPEGVRFRQDLQRREQARVAFVRSDNDNAYRRALLRRSRPRCQSFEPGDWILYWRRHTGGTRGDRGRWYGPGQVICSDPKVVWVSHCGRLIRAAPEQLRSASMREWREIAEGRQVEVPGQLAQDTRGVVDLLSQGELPSRIDVETEGEAPVAQPEVLEGDSAPVDMDLGVAEGVGPAVAVVDPEQPEHEVSPTVSMQSVPEQETAPEPEAYDVPVPSDDEELLFGDTECFLAYPESGQAWEIVLHESEIKFADLPSASQSLHFAMLASAERKKRVEVRMRDLTAEERGLFDKAKDKEVRAWLDHRTVRRVAQGTLDDRQLMRCRWLLTWKPPEKEGGPKRAKARLVVLGFEDPGLQEIPNDAPTLGKDARQLLIQKVVSNRWKLINFDISTAFLQGRGDGRKLGIRPPEELRAALGMKPEDQCQLDGGAYGRIDAPFLWFQTLKETLEKLGFLQSPFDACSFSLVTQDKQGKPKVHGVLGVHVDDGIGGGDAYFSRVIQQLRDIYSFGSYEEGDFTFTGIRFRQWDDCSVEMDQIQYIEKIQPIHVSRNRRAEPNAPLCLVRGGTH